MNTNYLGQYERMVTGLNEILKKEINDKEKMELCFRCCIDNWNILKEKIISRGFESDANEILFFKSTKPRFTGEIEYYIQRYHALQFLPEKEKQLQINFWHGELSRLDKFFAAWQEFFTYHKSGKTDRDELYFLRRNNDGSNINHAAVYDLDQRAASSHDWLLSCMIAYEKYKCHIDKELQRIF